MFAIWIISTTMETMIDHHDALVYAALTTKWLSVSLTKER